MDRVARGGKDLHEQRIRQIWGVDKHWPKVRLFGR